MQFVHKYHDYTHVIHSGVGKMLPGAGDAYVRVETAPNLLAVFTRRQLPITRSYGNVEPETAAFVWRELARQFFDGKDAGKFGHEQFGAYRHDGVTTATDGEGDNVFFSGSQREMFYGVFDTEDQSDCEPQHREIYEAVLTADAEACQQLSQKHGYLGTLALHPTTDLRAGEMVILDKLLEGGYGEFIVQTPDGPFVTGLGLTRTHHTPISVALPAEVAPAQGAWPLNFPWPGFDDLGGHQMKRAKIIAETCILINADLQRVLAYEIEHKAEKPTITRLTKLIADAGTPAPAPVVDDAEETPAAEEALIHEMATTIP